MAHVQPSRTRHLRIVVMLLAIFVLSAQAVLAQDFNAPSLEGFDRSGKVSNTLINASLTTNIAIGVSSVASGTPARIATADTTQINIRDGAAMIDFIAAGDVNALVADLQALGLRDMAVYEAVVSGFLPLGSIPALAELDSLRVAIESVFMTNGTPQRGAVSNEAVEAMAVDIANDLYGVDGTGLKIGVISDSFDCGQFGGLPGTTQPNRYQDDIDSGDLPAGITVLEDWTCGIDEGRAMAQLIHDVAPGAELAFHTANGGLGNFAQGIIDLADWGADVIVDDIIYLAEPMFSDGVIAQAVDEVTSRGISYFSSAGNRTTAGYQSPFNPVLGDLTAQGIGPGFVLHDFDPGPGVDVFQTVTLDLSDPSARFDPWFQWTDPVNDIFNANLGTGFPTIGNQSEVDILPFINGVFAPQLYSAFGGLGGLPIDFLGADYIPQPGETFEIAFWLVAGPPPELMRYVDFAGRGADIEWGNDSPTLYGHNNAGGRTGNAEGDPDAIGAIAVAASFWRDTPAFGVNPPRVNAFSSWGPTPIYYDVFGVRYDEPDVQPKPQITAPDGSNTTFFFGDTSLDADANPNFFGTSAAAPHAAAVAALMLQADPSLTPREILENLQLSAIDIVQTNDIFDRYFYNVNNPLPAGFDFASGAGLIQANVAVQLSISSPSMECNGLAATIYVENGVIVGGPMNGQAYNGVLRGGNQADVIVGTNVADRIRSGNNNDTICSFDGDDNINSGHGKDTVFAGNGNDIINGGTGEDTLNGEGDDDRINAGSSRDTVNGGDGNDIINGGEGEDTINGGPGDDIINGGNGQDVIDAGEGEDEVRGGRGDDRIIGGPDADELRGGDGQDQLWGDGGEDQLFGNNGDDRLYGGEDGDILRGGNNNDRLFGEGGDDFLFGNPGDDRLDGGEGTDACNAFNINQPNTVNCE